MRNFYVLFLVFCFLASSSFAVNFDTSIDAEIRKTNNIQSSESLPVLPSVVPTEHYVEEAPIHKATGKKYILKDGTKIQLVSQNIITDRTRVGSRVSFVCKNGILTKEREIIPAGTVFKGIITDSHAPQLSGNGGLIELKIDEIYFNGVKSKIDSKLSVANFKKVFLGNIKGERSYWKNIAKITKPGRKVFGATQTAASTMAVIPVVNIFSFIPLVGGAVVYSANVVVSPIIAVFTKGGSLSFPAGTVFEIKMTKDSEING